MNSHKYSVPSCPSTYISPLPSTYILQIVVVFRFHERKVIKVSIWQWYHYQIYMYHWKWLWSLSAPAHFRQSILHNGIPHVSINQNWHEMRFPHESGRLDNWWHVRCSVHTLPDADTASRRRSFLQRSTLCTTGWVLHHHQALLLEADCPLQLNKHKMYKPLWLNHSKQNILSLRCILFCWL